MVSPAEQLPDSPRFFSMPPHMTELVIRRERKQARYFKEKLGEAIGLDMILVLGDTFLMGSPEGEPERLEREPQHEVTVPTFFMGRYPVTQMQWRFVAALPQAKQELNPDPSSFKGDHHPVESVSWYDAVEFCDRLSAYTKREYRLPTEAEWEYACRSGTQTPFYFGNTLTTELANYDGNYTYNDGTKGEYREKTTPVDPFDLANATKGEYREKTTPVDHFDLANAFGLCDMHGNVWEWCQDHWHESYKGAPTDGSAWLNENDNDSRIRRGGSWHSNPRACRSACRYYDSPDVTYDDLGFRIVCSAPRTL